MSINRECFVSRLLQSMYGDEPITDKRRKRALKIERVCYWQSSSYIIYKASITTVCLDRLLIRVDRLSNLVTEQLNKD